MIRRAAALLSTLLLCLLSVPSCSGQKINPNSGLSPTQIETKFGHSPLSFEINQGQTDARVRFLTRGTNSTLFLTDDGSVLDLQQSAPAAGSANGSSREGRGSAGEDLWTHLVGARLDATVLGEDQLEGNTNYLIGNDPNKWHTHVSHFRRVRYVNIYPGIDLLYYGNESGRLEHDFIVAPNADPTRIAFRISGAKNIHTDPAGDLIAELAKSSVTLQKPRVYQEVDGKKRYLDARYRLLGTQVGFDLPTYDKRFPLIIDPVLVWATYAPPDGAGMIGMGVDAAGNVYVGGTALVTPFPDTPGAEQSTCSAPDSVGGTADCGYVMKFDPTGSTLLYATFIGGRRPNQAGNALAVDSQGEAVLVGSTSSEDFPTTPNAYQTGCVLGFRSTLCASGNAFISKLNSDGSALLYSTLLERAVAQSVAVDNTGSIYVAGSASLPQPNDAFPTTSNAFQRGSSDTSGAFGDAFLARIDTTAFGPASLVYSTRLGGSNNDIAFGVATDGRGHAFLTGATLSPDFPTTPNAYSPSCLSCIGQRSFIAEIDTNQAGAASLPYSSFFAGNRGTAIAADLTGHAYVTGENTDSTFPTTPGVVQSTCGGGSAFIGFLAKFDPSQFGPASLSYSTCMNGAPSSIAVDSTGNAYVAGELDINFAILVDPFEGQSGFDFVTKLSPDATSYVWSSRIGGWNNNVFATRSAGEQGDTALVLDSAGNVYVGGRTDEADFPTTDGAYDPPCTFSKGCRLITPFFPNYIAKISQSSGAKSTLNPGVLSFATQAPGTSSGAQTVFLRDMGDASLTVNSISISGNNPADFTQTNTCGTLPGQLPGAGECLINVVFAPTSPGLKSATIVVNDSGSANPHQVTLSGLGSGPAAVSFSPPSVSLSVKVVGEKSPAQPVTATNIGGSPLNITSVSITGDFSETDNCANVTLQPGQSCSSDVIYTPTPSGTGSGALIFADNAAGSPQSVPLSGTVLTKISTATSISSSANPAIAGQLVTFTATVVASSGMATGSIEFDDAGVSVATVPLTASQAQFSTSSLSAGQHQIVANYLGTTSFASSKSSTVLEDVLTIPAGTAIYGVVTDRGTGAPIPGALLSLNSNKGPMLTVTDQNGAYTLTGTQLGLNATGRLSFQAQGHFLNLVTYDVSGGAAILNVSLLAGPTLIQGTVRDASTQQGIGGATVNLFTLAAPSSQILAVSAVDGTYSVDASQVLESAASGFTVSQTFVTAAGYFNLTANGFTAQPSFPVTQDFSLQPATGVALQGVVTDRGTGAPIPGALLSLNSNKGPMLTVTDQNGAYTLTGTQLGSIATGRLSFQAQGHFLNVVTYDVSGGAAILNVSLLAGPTLIQGTVRDASTQQGIGGATVDLFTLAAPSSQILAVSAVDGTYSVDASQVLESAASGFTVSQTTVTAAAYFNFNANGFTAQPPFPATQDFSLTWTGLKQAIMIDTTPAGLSFTVDGIAYSAAQPFNWIPGSPHSISTSSPQPSGAGSQFAFSNWNIGGPESQTISAPAQASTITANFTTQYQVITAVNPQNAGAVSAGGYFNAGAQILITATPNSGFLFNGFSGDLLGTTNPQMLLIDNPKSVTANFIPVAAPTSTSLISSLSASGFDEPITFIATVTSSAGTPTGTVTFMDGNATLGSSPLINGRVTATFMFLGVGPHTIIASYSGSPNFAPSVSAPVPESVSQASTSINLSVSANPSISGQAVTFTASIVTQFGGQTTGSIAFMDGSTVLGSVPISGNVASLSTATLGVGTHPIGASYLGDTNFTGSTSGVLSEVIQAPFVQLVTVPKMSTDASGRYVAQITVTNNGNVSAIGVQLVTLVLNTTATTSALPQALGSIPPHSSAIASVIFASSAGTAGSAGALRVGGSYSGGTFGGSFRVTLP